MKKILLMIPCMVLALLVLFPVKAEAFEYNGTEYATMTSFNYYMGYGTLDLHRHEIYSTNPDAKILVIISLFKRDDGTYGYPAWLVSVGGDTEITVFRNGTCVIEKQLVQEVNMDALNAGFLNNLGEGGSYDAETGIFPLIGYMGSYDPTSGSPAPYVSDISGYMIEIPYDDSIGNPTRGHVKYAVENIESLKHQKDIYDEDLGIPLISHVKETAREYIKIKNPSGNKIEMRIKIYGPSKIYIDSISANPLKKFLDKYNWAVAEEVSSSLYLVDGYKDDREFYFFGITENYESVEGNFVNLADLFVGFTTSCKDSCVLEYKDDFTKLQDLGNKADWDRYLSLSNSDMYEFEIYARFYDDSGIDRKCGKWNHIVIERGGNFKQSGNDTGDDGNDGGVIDLPDDDVDNRDDGDLNPVVPEVPEGEMDVEGLWNTIQNLVYGIGDVPFIFGQVFGFMPSWLQFMIAFGIGAIVVLRFLGR